MKKEIRQAINQGIKEAEKNGYKWTITANGLNWSYGVKTAKHTAVKLGTEQEKRF